MLPVLRHFNDKVVLDYKLIIENTMGVRYLKQKKEECTDKSFIPSIRSTVW